VAEAAASASRRRWVSWLRRTSLRVRIAAGVAAAAVLAAIVFVAVPSSSPPPKPAYTSLPAPCDLVSLATLARYLPNPTGTPQSTSPLRTVRAGACKWSSTTGGQDRALHAVIGVFGSSSPVTDAHHDYNATVSALGCHCKGVSVSTRPVTGLGDDATAVFITAGPDPDFATAPNAIAAGVNLIVWSSNAEMTLSYSAIAAGTVLPPDPAKLDWLIAVAHGILADLARPAAISAAPVSPEPHYAGSRDPCRLVTAATLARYAPGAAVTGDTNTSVTKDPTGARTTTCSWLSASGSIYVMLKLDVFPDAASAQLGFDEDAQGFSQTGGGLTVTGTRWLTDLGEEAAALDQTRGNERGVEMLVWSGNIELDYWYSDIGSPPPDSTMLLAGGIAMARDGLAALASPSASSYPQGPVYANPHDACPLVRGSTLARFVPGATVGQTPGPNPVGPELSTCQWNAPTGILILSVTIDADADGAQAYYQVSLQQARENQAGTRFDGAQSVPGLGNQATAVFLFDPTGSPEVNLEVWSGNAEVEMSIDDPALSRAQKLAADIAMARDVLTDLPRART
jgi:hypothetical protein